MHTRRVNTINKNSRRENPLICNLSYQAYLTLPLLKEHLCQANPTYYTIHESENNKSPKWQVGSP